MKKVFLTVSVAAATLAGCNKENITGPQRDAVPDNEIKLSVSSVSVDVKSAYDATEPSEENPLLARVFASTSNDFSTGEYGSADAGYMNFTSSALTGFCNSSGTASPKYFDADNSVYLAGYYPSEGWTITPASNSAGFTFTGEEDVMATGKIGIDKTSEDADKAITFKHLLTQLELTVKAGGTAAVTEWNGIYDITLSKAGGADPDNTVTVTYSGNDVRTAFSGAVQNTGMKFICNQEYTESSRYTLTTEETSIGYMLCEPVDAGLSDNDYTLSINTGRGPQTIPVELEKAGDAGAFDQNTAGYKFTVSLTFNVNEIQAKATIEPWKDGGKTEIVVEG